MAKRIAVVVDVSDSAYVRTGDDLPEVLMADAEAGGNKQAIAYEALFYPESAGSKKSMHRGPCLTITVDGKTAGAYEIVIDDAGKPRFVDVDADPVEPGFAASL